MIFSLLVPESFYWIQSIAGFFGYSYGEGGIGFELAGAARSFGDATAWQMKLGMTVRIPAVLGVLLVPIPLPT